MKKLIERNHKSIVDRGLITPNTTKMQFIDKIFEEVNELESYYLDNNGEIDEFELADIILVCLNMAKHYNIDIEKILLEKIKINERRSKETD